MRKLYRGEVILVWAPAGIAPNGAKKLKERPVIVLKDTKKDDDAISVYCTTQNDGDDKNNILVLAKSENGLKMGLTKDTYIRPKQILTIPSEFIVRSIGKCPLMQEINKIIDRNMGL